MIRSSSSEFWNTTRPCTTSSTTTSPSSGFLKRTTGCDARPRIACGRASARRSAASRRARVCAGAHLLELLLGAVAAVGVAAREQLVDDLLVAVEALGLVERTLVVIEPRPFHAVQNLLDGLGRGALEIRILDAQHERAAHAAAHTASRTAPCAVRRCAESRSGWGQIGCGRSWALVFAGRLSGAKSSRAPGCAQAGARRSHRLF